MRHSGAIAAYLFSAAVLLPLGLACKSSSSGGTGGQGGSGAGPTGGASGYAGQGGQASGGDAGQAGQAGSAGQGSCDVVGTWNCTVTNLDDPAGHSPYIGKPFTSAITCSSTGSTMSCTGMAPFVDVTGSLGAGCTFDLSGSGTVAGYPNVSVKMTGSGATGKLVGDYTMGAGGELPQGKPMIVTFSGTKQ